MMFFWIACASLNIQADQACACRVPNFVLQHRLVELQIGHSSPCIQRRVFDIQVHLNITADAMRDRVSLSNKITSTVKYKSEVFPHPLSLGMNRFVLKPVTIIFLQMSEHIDRTLNIVKALPEVATNQRDNHESRVQRSGACTVHNRASYFDEEPETDLVLVSDLQN